jgi:hypothetical protein
MSEDATLADLHEVVQTCMGWYDEHLHEFRVGDRSYGPVDDDAGDDETATEDEAGVFLSDIFARKGSKIAYEYDFGDSWVHEVVFENKVAANPDKPCPVCVAGERAGPPDDCGGVPGYMRLLEALADPGDPASAELIEWVAEDDFDPEHFDIDEVNVRLAMLGVPAEAEGELARLAIMEIIETQLEDDNPPETGQTLRRLMREGKSEDEAWDLIACALTFEIFRTFRDRRDFDTENYIRILNALPALPYD